MEWEARQERVRDLLGLLVSAIEALEAKPYRHLVYQAHKAEESLVAAEVCSVWIDFEANLEAAYLHSMKVKDGLISMKENLKKGGDPAKMEDLRKVTAAFRLFFKHLNQVRTS